MRRRPEECLEMIPRNTRNYLELMPSVLKGVLLACLLSYLKYTPILLIVYVFDYALKRWIYKTSTEPDRIIVCCVAFCLTTLVSTMLEFTDIKVAALVLGPLCTWISLKFHIYER